jgi:hypothetical protein
MQPDICQHQITQVVLKAGAIIRSLRGLPPENNVTLLYGEIAPLLGISVVPMNSKNMDHLPSPIEMKNEKGKFIIPNKPCPRCGKTAFLGSICQSCEDAKDENGKVVYKSGYLCDARFGGCGFIDEKNGEWITQRVSKMGREIPTGTKESLGIGTATDEGVK